MPEGKWRDFVVLLTLFLSVAVIGGCSGPQAGRRSEPPSDRAITTEIRARIGADSDLCRLKIRVVTSGGEVVLKGTVPSRRLEVRLIKLALAVEGVISVKDEISVMRR